VEFCITKALRLHFHLVFNNSDVFAFTIGKEVLDIFLGGIERKISEVYSIRGLVGQWELLSNRVT